MLIAALILLSALLLSYVLMTNHYGATDTAFTWGLRAYQVIIAIAFLPTLIYLVTSGKLHYQVAAGAILIIALLFVEFEALDDTQYSLVGRR